ncbi:MAG: YdeI/OmpD-associated family protein [Gemmatimonadetes bacterium]|nr:YdeI/OmpD-associated family protein [Gemmatimonadota bacterium]
MDPTDVTYFDTPELFRAWLQAHHAGRDVLWVGYLKKATGRPSMTWEESVDEALCFGWIDGIRKRVDDERYTIRFTPRGATSIWSQRNIERFRALRESGRVAAPGEAAHKARTEDKSGVYAFEQKKPLALSHEYEMLMRANPAAWASWEGRPPGYRRTASFWVMSAKRQATRDRRLASLIEACAAGRKVKPLRVPGE